jgi:nucleoside-diphosphate-sugar epimerase
MFTIFGAGGWIGSAMARRASACGHEVRAVMRNKWPSNKESLGHVIYAIGLTADFRDQPLATAQAHVAALVRALESFRFDSFLYLSSTRVYLNASATVEGAALSVRPAEPDNLYNITKLAGEAVCLSLPTPTIRVARLSNVVGLGDHSNNFLSAVLAEARQARTVMIRSSPDSEKDYIALDDVTALTEAIALRGRHRIYNIASGRNVSHRLIGDLLRRHTGVSVNFISDAPRVSFPQIVIERVRSEFDLDPTPFEAIFSDLICERWLAQTETLPAFDH